MTTKRIAMISFHTCPLASEEGKETGGMNVYVLELSKELARQGYHVDMYTRCQNKGNPDIAKITPNLRLIHLKSGPMQSINKKELIQHIPEFVKSYRYFVRKENLNYDILHCHYYLSGLIGLKINESFDSRTPIIMTFHTLALMKNLVARDELEKEEIERIDAENILTKKANLIIAPSESDKEYLKYLYNTESSKILVIPPGVNISLFRPIRKDLAKKKIGADINHKIILFVGRIEPLKGLDMLLYAMKVLVVKNPNLKACLWIVGGDISQKPELWSKQLQTLQQLKQLLNITTQVKFVGQRKQNELPYYYSAAEMVVMPSLYESFGMVTLEAMACGVPVITTNVTGVSSLIDKEHKSLITSVNNPLLLASQIKYLLTNEKDHEKISSNLLATARKLNWKDIVTKITKIYEKTVLSQ